MDNYQAVPKSPWLGIESYSPGYTAIWRTPQGTQLHTCTHLSVATRASDHSRLVIVSSHTVSLRY
jgi:hypothetical protein